MQLHPDGTLSLSPSDLTAFLACPHLTQLDAMVARGELTRPGRSESAQLIADKGEEHERAYLAELRAAGSSVLELPRSVDFEANAAATAEAVRRGGHDVLYQACFSADGWRGFADFLERQPDGTYEPVDTKLARHAKPSAVLQLTFYAHELERLQARLPERMHVVLGTGERESFRPADFAAFYRHARRRLREAAGTRPHTYPYRVEHCRMCEFKAHCERRWRDDDHPILVAGIRRSQVERLDAAGIGTVLALGEAPEGRHVPGIPRATFGSLRRQAALQLEGRRAGAPLYELKPYEEGRGLGLLPEPSSGDVAYDIEGDPYREPGRGLEYLHGLSWREGGGPRYRVIWAHDREAERQAVEAVIDFFHERLAADPGMHVYHYASYETAALKRLVAELGTREDALDELLRREVFVDLYTVARQALRTSHESLSIKDLESFYMARHASLRAGDDSILVYERWLRDRDERLLEELRAYNEEDCHSTLLLRDWLAERREEAERAFSVTIPWRPPPEPAPPSQAADALAGAREAVRAGLLAAGDPVQALAADLLEYHRREARPAWWFFFERLTMTAEELVEDSESIGQLEPDGTEPVPVARSHSVGFRFPVQQHKLDPGDVPVDPVTRAQAGKILELDSTAGTLRLKRGAVHDGLTPAALIPPGPYTTDDQQRALLRFGASLAAGDGRYPHLERLLRREPPLHGARVQRDSLEEMVGLVERIEGTYLCVQGPPGSGKTWTGARMIVQLLDKGKRVGVASTSHKAIHKLLEEVESAAAEAGVRFTGLKKSTDVEGTAFDGNVIENERDPNVFASAPHDLLAGTAWLFAREDLDAKVDVLFVDEAGQVSLADALALGTCARAVVLLGDPVQLAHVRQGTHPNGSGVSVLEHLLGDRATVEETMGLFLERSWRMHPDVCRYVSAEFYEGRLHAAEPCARQGCSLGTGVRWLPVPHEGRTTESPEEADALRAEIDRLLGAEWTDASGVTRAITTQDVIVVTPYNAQVRLLRERLQPGVDVGTVDKFQGQEAPVVLFSMATSSGADAPRGIDFVLSRNRLNVAISRARCLAVLACSPSLLDVEARTIEHMRLANALCRFVEVADAQAPARAV